MSVAFAIVTFLFGGLHVSLRQAACARSSSKVSTLAAAALSLPSGGHVAGESHEAPHA